MKVSDIQKTTEYHLFQTISGNRSISAGHLKGLIASIGHRNMLPDNPIKVNEKMQIIDGQHRLEAARELELPIYYIVMDGARLAEVQMLNTNQKNWTIENIVNSYCDIGRDDYITLRSFHERHGFPYSIAARILSGANAEKGEKKSLWTGSWKVADLPRAEAVAEAIIAIKDKTEDVVWKQKSFVIAFIKMLDVVSFERFKQKLEISGTVLGKRRGIEDYLRLFEEIVNFHEKENKRVRLF